MSQSTNGAMSGAATGAAAGASLGPWGMAGGAILGGASGFFSAKGAESNNKAMIALAREQMAFQERMSSTAHQREVKDLRDAGLNPILSATGGPGASTPQGQTAKTDNAAAVGIASAMDTLRTMAESFKAQTEANYIATAKSAQTEAQTTEAYASAQNLDASAYQNRSKGDLNLSHINLNDQQVLNLQQSLSNLQQTNKLLQSQTALTTTQEAHARATINNLQQQFKTLQAHGDIDASEYGKLMYIAKLGADNLGAATGGLSKVLKSMLGKKSTTIRGGRR
jgi:rubrerythrin